MEWKERDRKEENLGEGNAQRDGKRKKSDSTRRIGERQTTTSTVIDTDTATL